MKLTRNPEMEQLARDALYCLNTSSKLKGKTAAHKRERVIARNFRRLLVSRESQIDERILTRALAERQKLAVDWHNYGNTKQRLNREMHLYVASRIGLFNRILEANRKANRMGRQRVRHGIIKDLDRAEANLRIIIDDIAESLAIEL